MEDNILDEKITWQEKLPEKLTSSIGTMGFIYKSSAIILLWILVNIFGVAIMRYDPYPFVFLNLGFSAFAFYSAPLILMAQNRQADADRKKVETDLATDLEALKLLKTMIVHFNIPVEE